MLWLRSFSLSLNHSVENIISSSKQACSSRRNCDEGYKKDVRIWVPDEGKENREKLVLVISRSHGPHCWILERTERGLGRGRGISSHELDRDGCATVGQWGSLPLSVWDLQVSVVGDRYAGGFLICWRILLFDGIWHLSSAQHHPSHSGSSSWSRLDLSEDWELSWFCIPNWGKYLTTNQEQYARIFCNGTQICFESMEPVQQETTDGDLICRSKYHERSGWAMSGGKLLHELVI